MTRSSSLMNPLWNPVGVTSTRSSSSLAETLPSPAAMYPWRYMRWQISTRNCRSSGSRIARNLARTGCGAAVGVREVRVVGTSFHFSERVTQGCDKWLDIVRDEGIERAAADLKARGFKL